MSRKNVYIYISILWVVQNLLSCQFRKRTFFKMIVSGPFVFVGNVKHRAHPTFFHVFIISIAGGTAPPKLTNYSLNPIIDYFAILFLPRFYQSFLNVFCKVPNIVLIYDILSFLTQVLRNTLVSVCRY